MYEPKEESTVPGTESKIVKAGADLRLVGSGEAVDHPAHYNRGKIEVIDYLEDCMTPEAFEGFLQGNVLKYMSRYQLKNGLEDLKKADWYLDYLIDFKKRQQADQG